MASINKRHIRETEKRLRRKIEILVDRVLPDKSKTFKERIARKLYKFVVEELDRHPRRSK